MASQHSANATLTLEVLATSLETAHSPPTFFLEFEINTRGALYTAGDTGGRLGGGTKPAWRSYGCRAIGPSPPASSSNRAM